jgi:hypothetical protein
MVGLGQAVLDAIVDTDAAEDVATRRAVTVAVAMLGQVGEGYPIVGEHGVDLVGEGLDHVPEEGRSRHLAGLVVELDAGEFRDPVDGKEHDQLAVGVAQLATVDVDVADLVGLEPLALLLGLLDRQPGDAVALQAAVQGAAAEVGEASLRQPNTSSSGSRVFWRKATTMASSAGVSTVLFGALGPIGASAVVVRLRHLRTVLGFRL